MDNQASEIDTVLDNYEAFLLKFNDETSKVNLKLVARQAIKQLIRTEKLKLLDSLERKSIHYTPDGLAADSLDPWAVSVSTINTVRNKLEAEL